MYRTSIILYICLFGNTAANSQRRELHATCKINQLIKNAYLHYIGLHKIQPLIISSFLITLV